MSKKIVSKRIIAVSASEWRWLKHAGSVLFVAERMSAEGELVEQRSFLRQVIDLNPNFIFAKDREGRFTLVNQAIAEAYGTTAEGLLGRTDAEFNSNREEAITDAAGEVRWLQTIKRPIVSPDGAANQTLGVATDITARKRAEDALRERDDQLRQAQKMEAVGKLAAGGAHDFNNLLTIINGQAALSLRRLGKDDPLYGKLEAVRGAGERSASLVC